MSKVSCPKNPLTADYDKMKKLFFVTNVDWFFISHRLPLALNAIQQGYEVYLLSRDTGRKQFYKGKGFALSIFLLTVPEVILCMN